MPITCRLGLLLPWCRRCYPGGRRPLLQPLPLRLLDGGGDERVRRREQQGQAQGEEAVALVSLHGCWPV